MQFAHITDMGEFFVYSFFAGMFFFLFPVFVYVDGYVDVLQNKAWFSISVYKIFKVFGGYAQLKPDGIVIHLTEKKAVFVFYAQMGETRKKFEITDGFQLYKFHQIVETGGAHTPAGILIASFLQSFGGAACALLKTRYPFISLKNGTLLAEKPCLKISAQVVTIFNGLVMTIAITKKILEVIINWIRKRKSIASLKKQRSN